MNEDYFAARYGWTLEHIRNLSEYDAQGLIEAIEIKNRKSEQEADTQRRLAEARAKYHR